MNLIQNLYSAIDQKLGTLTNSTIKIGGFYLILYPWFVLFLMYAFPNSIYIFV